MPGDHVIRRIGREAALLALGGEPAARCLVCGLLAGDRGRALVIAETERSQAVLTRYPRHWGHTLVLFRRHVCEFADLDREDWADASALAARVATCLESSLSPARVYVASLGTARTDVPMSSPHFHLHVVPVPDRDLRPADVFSWTAGVLSAPEERWQSLAKQLSDSMATGAGERRGRGRCRSPR